MRAITLRNIPPEVARRLERRAVQRKASLNRTVIELLEEALGIARKSPVKVHGDLDFLIGSWDEEQSREFDDALAEHRRVDPEAWK